MLKYQSTIVFGLLVGGMSGCALDSSAGDGAEHASSTQEAASSYSQNFEEATQSIVFSAPAGTAWVDLHATLGASQALNARMTADGSTFRLGPLAVDPGARISYSFTFLVNGAAQSTPVYSYTAPTGSPLLALRPQVASYSTGTELQLIALSDLDWADVHYSMGVRG
jgi:hypothetical protein